MQIRPSQAWSERILWVSRKSQTSGYSPEGLFLENEKKLGVKKKVLVPNNTNPGLLIAAQRRKISLPSFATHSPTDTYRCFAANRSSRCSSKIAARSYNHNAKAH